MPASPPLTALLLAATAAVLPAASASDLVATDKHHGGDGGRMVIIRPTGTTSAAAGARSRWRQRRLEDEVAPEFGGGLLLGADQGRYISYDALNKDRTACGNRCNVPGEPYRQPPRKEIYGCRG